MPPYLTLKNFAHKPQSLPHRRLHSTHLQHLHRRLFFERLFCHFFGILIPQRALILLLVLIAIQFRPILKDKNHQNDQKHQPSEDAADNGDNIGLELLVGVDVDRAIVVHGHEVGD